MSPAVHRSCDGQLAFSPISRFCRSPIANRQQWCPASRVGADFSCRWSAGALCAVECNRELDFGRDKYDLAIELSDRKLRTKKRNKSAKAYSQSGQDFIIDRMSYVFGLRSSNWSQSGAFQVMPVIFAEDTLLTERRKAMHERIGARWKNNSRPGWKTTSAI